jgi:hypothetical protein
MTPEQQKQEGRHAVMGILLDPEQLSYAIKNGRAEMHDVLAYAALKIHSDVRQEVETIAQAVALDPDAPGTGRREIAILILKFGDALDAVAEGGHGRSSSSILGFWLSALIETKAMAQRDAAIGG